MEVLIDGRVIEFYVEKENCRIIESYLIKNRRAKYNFIFYLQDHFEEFKKRSAKSYYREWKAHNILYKWGIKKESTKDTNLNINENFIRRLGYFLLAMFFVD